MAKDPQLDGGRDNRGNSIWREKLIIAVLLAIIYGLACQTLSTFTTILEMFLNSLWKGRGNTYQKFVFLFVSNYIN